MSALGAGRPAPHIRLNSNQGNLLTQGSPNNRPPPPVRQDSGGRSLIPQTRAPVPPPIRTQPSYQGLYSPNNPQDSASSERLLPPGRSRTHRFRDDDVSARGSPDPMGFRTPSGLSSRRTSWSSDAGSRDSRIYGSNPFDDSRAPSRAGSDDGDVNTQTVSEKYNILPSAGLLLFPEDVEKDDWLHNPDPNDKDRECDIFTKRGLVNIGGLAFLLIGILILFVGYPVMYVSSEFCQCAQKLLDFFVTPNLSFERTANSCNPDPLSRDTLVLATHAQAIQTASILVKFRYSRMFDLVS